jgi:hypothetical protein
MTSRTWLASVLLIPVLTAAAPSRADVITTTATLPLLGVPYASSVGAGCFPAIDTCVTAGSLTLTTLVSNTFNPAGEDIVTDAVFTATLTDTSNHPTGAISLTGTVEQEVLGRTTSTQTGTWTVDITSGLLSGPLLGNTLTVTVDGSQASAGITSITPVDGGEFSISSFFDVFLDLTLDRSTPLHATVGPIQLTAGTPAPEPASLALLCLPLLALWTARRPELRVRS